ncbi:putative 8-amino-7-oxononanoate synthase bioF1 [Mycobacterium xenopi 3993]|nr:putative 8-amino-7-oxononanoate synthase bioF1 [Mycobacterium xenopi 3993]
MRRWRRGRRSVRWSSPTRCFRRRCPGAGAAAVRGLPTAPRAAHRRRGARPRGARCGRRGLVHELGLAGAPDVVMTATLSKALGSQGGAVLGPPEVRIT